MSKTETTTHTPGAIRAAKIIMARRPEGSLQTEYGRKTIEGLADLIDRQTAAPDLLEACEVLIAYGEYTPHDLTTTPQLKLARDAIAKAKGE